MALCASSRGTKRKLVVAILGLASVSRCSSCLYCCCCCCCRCCFGSAFVRYAGCLSVAFCTALAAAGSPHTHTQFNNDASGPLLKATDAHRPRAPDALLDLSAPVGAAEGSPSAQPPSSQSRSAAASSVQRSHDSGFPTVRESCACVSPPSPESGECGATRTTSGPRKTLCVGRRLGCSSRAMWTQLTLARSQMLLLLRRRPVGQQQQALRRRRRCCCCCCCFPQAAFLCQT